MVPYARRVNYYETDKMGVVHHSNYIRWFEEARTHFMETAGYTYPRLEAEGIISPVIAVSCEYKKPVRYAEDIVIEVYLTAMSRFRCSFAYKVKDTEGNLRATGSSQHCYLSETGAIVNIEKTAPVFYDTFRILVDGEAEK